MSKDQRIYQHGMCDIVVFFCYEVPNQGDEAPRSAVSQSITGHGSHCSLYLSDICCKSNAGGH